MKLASLRIAALVCLCAVATGCDKEAPNPDQAQQAVRDQEGEAWRSLLVTLDQSPDDATRVKVLERFLLEHPDHPDVSGAKQRLDKLQKASSELAVMKKQALEEGNPSALVSFFVVASAPTIVSKELADPLGEPMTLQTPEGPVQLENSVLTTPSRVRSHVRRVITAHAPSLIEERCDEECLNQAINALVKPVTGTAVVEGKGRLNKDAVGTLLEKAFVTPDTDLYGTPAAKFYTAFQPTVRAYAAVGKAAREAGVEEAAKKLQSLSEPRETLAFYRTWTEEAKIAQTTELDSKVAGNITSWWIRRYADGSGPVFAEYLRKVIDAYDPEYAPKLQ